MLIQYAYIKPRSQFGKQCFFEETAPTVEENIQPDPGLMRDYIHRDRCHSGVQKSEQFALHEMQTVSKVIKETGMLHSEGGWPKEINARDEEAVQRFRRRVEKDDNWAPRMNKLTDPMERYVLQNNAINIYENYFDEMVPTALTLPRDVRTSNVYADPQTVVRPVSHMSWSPGDQNRLAAAYTFLEFETQPLDASPWSYIWDIENPNAPVMCLRSSLPLMTIEFNPRDPSMLISGLMSGQVCNWDIRIGNRPVQVSHRQFSHRNPANQALWITSKTNSEFFSASTDGTIKWWDIRKLKQPTDVLVVDLDDPMRADVVRAIGVTALQFEPTMGSRFMVGTENGAVINVNRKAATPTEKLATRFHCHVGPVITIDRNPFVPKNFLTVGDWTTKIWADDTREDSLIAIRSRYSVFFTISVTGLLEVYDVLIDVSSPVTAFRVCNESLTAVAPHEDGQLLAVGSHEGNIYLVECSEGHTANTRSDKANFTAYLDRCSRFEKTVDARLREIRLMRASAREDSAADSAAVVSKGKKKGNNKGKKGQTKDKGETKKKSRSKKGARDDAIFADDPELVESEAEFFRTVEKELASYPSLDLDFDRKVSLEQEISRKKKKQREPSKVEVEEVAAEPEPRKPVAREKPKVTRPRAPATPSTREAQAAEEEEEIARIEAPLAEPARPAGRRRERKTLGKVCAVEVCEPEICCADMEEERKAKLQAQLALAREQPSRDVMPTQLRKLRPDLEQKLPEHSAVCKRGSRLAGGESLTDVLADEVEEARREVRAWQRRVAAGVRDVWRPPRPGEVAPGAAEGEKQVDDDRSSGGKSGSESETSARRRGEAGELDPERAEGQADETPSVHSAARSDDATARMVTAVTSTTTPTATRRK